MMAPRREPGLRALPEAGEPTIHRLVQGPGRDIAFDRAIDLNGAVAFQVAHQRFVNRPGVDHRDLLPLVDRGG